MVKPVIADTKPRMVDVTAGRTYYWCACGLSENQPFCDGSHASTDITPLAWTAQKSGNVAFCACKQTATAPLCNGQHKNLG